MTTNDLITKKDLDDFKTEIIIEIKKLVAPEKIKGNKEWLRSADVRKLLNISPGTLQNMRINGLLPFTRIGSIIFYKLEDINSMLERE